MIDTTLAAWPVAYRIHVLLVLAQEFPRQDRLIELAHSLSREDVARALRYNQAVSSPVEGECPIEGDYVEGVLVADQVLRARVALDIAWHSLGDDAWGVVGDAVVSADELAEETRLAFWAVPETTWASLEADDPSSFRSDSASWWSEVRASLRADRAAMLKDDSR